MAMENQGSSVAAARSSEAVEGWVESVIVTVSQTSVGQALMKFIDRFLWVVEKSAQWSLPCQEIAAEENGKSFGRMELVRPLPWVLFLPGLVILRAIRGGLNVGAFILGYPKIQPSGMVRFVQRGRRRLRALNLKAVKNLRRKTHTVKAQTPEEKSATESAGSPMHAETKRKYSEMSGSDTDESANETLGSKIDRFALDSSSDDPDFNPAECTTESSTENDDDDHDEVSQEEIVDIKKDAMILFQEKMVPRTMAFYDLPEEEASQPLRQKSSVGPGDVEESRVADLQTVEEADNEFHSPNKFGQHKLQSNSHLTNDFINGEVNNSSGTPVLAGASTHKEVTNGVVTDKRPTVSGKSHHKGKRTSHGNRKKK